MEDQSTENFSGLWFQRTEIAMHLNKQSAIIYKLDRTTERYGNTDVPPAQSRDRCASCWGDSVT